MGLPHKEDIWEPAYYTISFMQKKQLASSTTYIQILPSPKYQIYENLIKRDNSCENIV